MADLDRQRHIEPYLTAVAQARSSRSGAPLSPTERYGRVLAVRSLLDDITEWGWADAPPRRLVFRSDMPRLPQPLPRYLPPNADRRLVAALEDSGNRLTADALLLQRACGLRIGELVDLELDCVHQVPGQGAWLKVPLGKLATERMVPLDEETVALVDRIVATRSPGRPIPHPRHGRPVQFLLTHHGRRLSVSAIRGELTRAAAETGLGASNGPTEAINLLIETTRRTGHGFRNFDNYRLRLLLAHGDTACDHGTPRIRGPRPRFVA